MTRRLVAATAALAMVVLAGCGETAEEPRPTGGADPGQQARAVLEKLDGEQVASRVQELRKLEFEGDGPEVRIVTPRQTVDYVRRQIERNYPADRIAADDALLKLAGILPPGGGLRALLDRFAGGSPVAVQAAEGWDGGTREVFERGEDRALAITTTWESEDEATEFAKAYEMSLGRDRGAKPAGEAFMLPAGQAADVVAAGRDVRIAVAPDPQLATKVAQEG